MFSIRRRRPELMDQPALEPALHDAALHALARVNRWSASASILWPALAETARRFGRVRVLDLATGAGDLPVRLWGRARKAGLLLEVAGCDRSAVAVEHACRRAERRGADVHFFVQDVLSAPLPGEYDVLMCSLFLHHLDESEACRLLSSMAHSARQIVLVNDLVRGTPGWLLAHVATRLLTGSPVVHTDGPRSVEAAFTVSEAADLAARAGLGGATVVRRWPCRWLLTWKRSEAAA